MDLDCLENTTKDYGIDMITVNVTANDDFDFADWLKDTPKKAPEPLVLKDDPVALSMASYRVWTETGARWCNLEDVTVTSNDRVSAEMLRKYYAGQMTFDALKGGGLKTPFRRKLYAIATKCHEYTKEDLGLLYRLPYFYDEDRALDQLITDFKSVEPSAKKELQGVFSLHKRMLRSRRSGDYYHYWLKHEGSLHLFNMVVKSDDVLRSLIESLLAQPREYTATAYYKGMRGPRRFNYVQLGNMRLV